jgi:hypothetical protein
VAAIREAEPASDAAKTITDVLLVLYIKYPRRQLWTLPEKYTTRVYTTFACGTASPDCMKLSEN